jgi:hypothetical protein
MEKVTGLTLDFPCPAEAFHDTFIYHRGNRYLDHPAGCGRRERKMDAVRGLPGEASVRRLSDGDLARLKYPGSQGPGLSHP